jgi:hypothetical protein
LRGFAELMLKRNYPPEKQRLHYSRLKDGGETWTNPVRITTDAGPPYQPDPGNAVQIAAISKHLLAVWDHAEEQNLSIFASRSNDGGKTRQTPWSLQQAATPVLWPHAVATPFGVQVFWLEQQAQKTWAMVKTE